MLMSTMNATCTNCGAHFSGDYKATFLGFKTLTCPKCNAQVTYPLTSGVRAFYAAMFVLGLAVVGYMLWAGYTFTGPSLIGCAIAFALIKDVYVRMQIAKATARFPVAPPA